MKIKSYKIVYEDDYIIVVNKAAGVYTISPRHATMDDVLSDLLEKRYKEIFIVHRLDKDTSGLVVFAKNSEIHKNLSIQFEENKIDKVYFAFVEGKLEFVGTYLIDVPILVDPGRQKVQIHDKGKPSQTKIRIVEQFSNHTLIEAKLITGRTHQIRVHMEYLGYPLMIDKLYGTKKEFYLSEIKRKYHRKEDRTERPLITRQTLHAHSMSLTHPVTGSKMNFEAELPKDLRALRYQLRKNS